MKALERDSTSTASLRYAPARMFGGWVAPQLSSEEDTRKARLLMAVLRALFGLGVCTFVIALFDPRNSAGVTFAFYVPVLLAMQGFALAVRRGHVAPVAWGLTLFFWALIAFVVLFFGGMKGHNAATFVVSIVLAGSLLGGRASLVLAVGACLWAGFVAWLELNDSLPPQLAPYDPVNAWSAVMLTLLLATVLVQASLDSLRSLHERAEASAKERDEALRRSIVAQKMEVVGNLASGIAHDFNNLLTVIASSAEQLRATVRSGDTESKEVLDDLESATLRATLMTRQLLSFGRAEGTLESVDLAAIVRALAPLLPRLLGSTIVITVDASQAAPVRAARAGLEQILLNLAVNARDAMPTGGTLTLVARPDGEHATLRVSDTGVGMSAETKARIFEAFFTTKAHGTGLGLATVHAVVTRFGGTIRVESELGVGTTFEVRLPLEQAVPESLQSATESVQSSAGARALVVEDDPLVRRTTTRLLESAGYDVVAVANGLEALGLLERTRDFAVVLTDISMPGLDGEELAGRLAAIYPELPVVLYSGNRAPSDATLAAPGRAFVQKPATRAALLDAIERARGEQAN